MYMYRERYILKASVVHTQCASQDTIVGISSSMCVVCTCSMNSIMSIIIVGVSASIFANVSVPQDPAHVDS